MAGVFLSSQAIDRVPARTLAELLHTRAFRIDSSPRHPSDGPDVRWGDWYTTGLINALRGAQIAVLVVDDGWDSSTWMAEEARLAFALLGDSAVFFWNPNDVQVRAAGMLPFLKARLPDDPAVAAARIEEILLAR